MGCLCCKETEKKEIVLLLLGLDNAGKTVAVKNLAGDPGQVVVPTIGFSVVTLEYQDYNIKLFDLGGRSDIRGIWERYFVDAHGIIFVVDSSDFGRLNEAQEVLINILSHDKIRGKPLLLLANKQDDELALDEIDLVEKLQLEMIVNEYECPTLIESCAATENKNNTKLDPGIKRGYNWLINYIIRDYTALNERVEIDVDKQENIDQRERLEKIARLQEINALEEKRKRDEDTIELYSEYDKKLNGLPQRDVFIIQNNKLKHSDSDSSQSADSLPHVYHGTIQHEIIPHQRPKSATNIIRKQLQLEKSGRKNSFKSFSSNKTAPINLYGLKPPQSVIERRCFSAADDRRNLKSTGDSIFVIPSLPNTVQTIVNCSGDLQRSFELITNSKKNKLPPINGINNSKYQNGNNSHDVSLENYV